MVKNVYCKRVVNTQLYIRSSRKEEDKDEAKMQEKQTAAAGSVGMLGSVDNQFDCPALVEVLLFEFHLLNVCQWWDHCEALSAPFSLVGKEV